MSKARFRTSTAWLVVASLTAGLLLSWTLAVSNGPAAQAYAQPVGDTQAIEQAKSLSRAFRSAAKEVLPTVVKVRTTTSRSANPFRGTPFEDFFGDELRGVPRPGLGSGVIIDSSGVVLTNNHVVRDADEVKVQLADGREFEVTDIKTDERTDLAVLRIKTDQPLPAAQLGDSDQLEIGDWVLAIGHPFELEQTVSAGIISGKGRSLGAVRRARFLQTDAAINPGNSGGPLVNLAGQVVGISTAIASRNGGNQGVGFAIPSNLARWVVPQLIKRGKVTRAYLGVSIVDLDAESAQKLGVPLDAGVVVAAVGPDSPAKQAGLQEGDVVVSFDGRRITTTSDLQELVERSPADSSHELKIIREGKPSTISVLVKSMPEDFEVAMQRNRFGGRMGTSEFYRHQQLGITVIEMTEAFAAQLGYEGLAGALIMHVDLGRIAAQAGLREGMLITRVGDKDIKSVAEFKEAIEKESLERGITLQVRSHRGTKTVTLQSS